MFFIPICAASDSGGMEFVMKKTMKRVWTSFAVISMLSMSTVCVAPENLNPEPNESSILHIHTAHANNLVNWQCRKCGQQWTLRSSSTPPNYGCGGDMGERHQWERM